MKQITKLRHKQSALIALLEFQPDTTLRTLAKKLAQKPTTVAYNIESLRSRNLIKRRAIVNFLALGYMAQTIYFSLSSGDEKARLKFINNLAKTESVAWLGSILGEYEFGLTVLVKNPLQAQELLERLVFDCKVSISERIISSRSAVYFFGRRYLSPLPETQKREAFELKYLPDTAIDQTDHGILSVLANQPVSSVRELARILGLSFATADRRYNLLKEKRIILGEIYDIDSDALGFGSFRLLVRAKMDKTAKSKILNFAKSTPQVVFLLEAFGTWDYELDIEVNDMLEAVAMKRMLLTYASDSINEIKLLGESEDYRLSFYPFTSLEF